MTYGYLIDPASQDAEDLRNLVAPAPYLGQVATRSMIPGAFLSTSKQMMSRTVHIARDDITSLTFLFPNWHCASGLGEQGSGAALNLWASLEYPLGSTPQRIYFSGASSVSIANLATATSDAVSISIPRNSPFAVKSYYTNSAGIIYSLGRNQVSGDPFLEGYIAAASGVTDNTLTTTNPSASVVAYGPCAIIGTTTRASVFFAGDSRVVGAGESAASQDPIGSKGLFERAIGKEFAFINAAASGDRVETALAGYARRLALAQYCSHVVSNYGINDIIVGRTAAQVLADLSSFGALFGTKPISQATLDPATDSTDTWATTANQSKKGYEQVRLDVNRGIRRVPAPYQRMFDVADVMETSRDSGIWNPLYTGDGLHASSLGGLKLEQSRAIDLRSFLRS